MEKGTPPSLTKGNRLTLGVALAGNVGALAIAVRGDDIASVLSLSGRSVNALLPLGAAGLVAGLLNAQLSADTKARIVFMRRDPLPGSRAFSHYVNSDARIDVSALKRRLGPLPTGPAEQNALWYKLYRSVQGEASVRDAQQQFLLWRDYTSMVLLLAIVLVPTAFALSEGPLRPLAFLALLGLQFGLAMQAARVHGERLVCNVLALKAAEEGAPP